MTISFEWGVLHSFYDHMEAYEEPTTLTPIILTDRFIACHLGVRLLAFFLTPLTLVRILGEALQ